MISFSLLPLLVIGFIAFVILRIIIAAVQSAAGNGPARSVPQATTQTAEDGFWILSCPADPEDIIYYRYWANGVRRSGQISFQPDNQGRQFVYTGEQPEQVSIVRIVSDAADASTGILPPIIGSTGSMWDPDPTPSQPSSPSSSGFPSAY